MSECWKLFSYPSQGKKGVRRTPPFSPPPKKDVCYSRRNSGPKHLSLHVQQQRESCRLRAGEEEEGLGWVVCLHVRRQHKADGSSSLLRLWITPAALKSRTELAGLVVLDTSYSPLNLMLMFSLSNRFHRRVPKMLLQFPKQRPHVTVFRNGDWSSL